MSMLNKLMLKDYVTLIGTMFGTSTIIISILGLILVEDFWIPFAGLMWAGALLADLLDGLVARRLHQSNEIGKEIDSLSDAISFCVAPAVLLFCASIKGEFIVYGLPPEGIMIGVFAIIFCGVVRLAWFNIDTENEGYTGMTTPMTAAFLISFYLTHHYFQDLNTFLPEYYNALLPINNFLYNTLSVTIIMVLIAISNIVTFLQYGKGVRKRSGIIKYLIILWIGLALIAIIIGRGLMGTAISKFTIHFMTLSFAIAVLGYMAYGFYHYLQSRKQKKSV